MNLPPGSVTTSWPTTGEGLSCQLRIVAVVVVLLELCKMDVRDFIYLFFEGVTTVLKHQKLMVKAKHPLSYSL